MPAIGRASDFQFGGGWSVEQSLADLKALAGAAVDPSTGLHYAGWWARRHAEFVFGECGAQSLDGFFHDNVFPVPRCSSWNPPAVAGDWDLDGSGDPDTDVDVPWRTATA